MCIIKSAFIISERVDAFHEGEVVVLVVELHVVPEVDGDAAVGLTEVVEPKTGKVEDVAGVHADAHGISVEVVGVGVHVGVQWVDADPGDVWVVFQFLGDERVVV